MKFLLWLYRDNDGSNGNGGLAGNITDALEKAEAAPAEEPAAPAETPAPEKPAAPAEDPEIEMEYEEEAGKGKAKVKTSEVRQTMKWLRENKDILGGAMKMHEEATKNPGFGNLLKTIIKNCYDEKGTFNKTYAEGTLKKLEAKEAVIEQKIDDTDDDIKDMETDLAELDAESPQAKILKRNIAALKTGRGQLREALKQNKTLQDRLDGLDKFKNDLTTEKETTAKTEVVKRISDIFDKEIGAMTAADKKDGYKFIDDDERADFDRAVRDGVAGTQGITTDDQFVKVTREVAKAVYDKMSKRREGWVNDYLRKKGQLPKDGTAVKPEKPAEPMNFEQMGAAIGDALTAPQT